MTAALYRILRVHNRYRERGGEDVAFEAEAGLLAERGHPVEVLEFFNDDIVERQSMVGAARLALTTIWSRGARDRIRTTIEAFQPDVVHFDNTFPLVSPAAYAVVRESGAAVVQTLHNYRLMCPSATFFRDGHICEDCLGRTPPLPGVIHGCYRQSRMQTAVVAAMLTTHRLRRTWSHDVDRYIVPTHFAKQKFLEAGFPVERLMVKPHFLPADPGGMSSRTSAILVVGRLADYKGTPLLPEAWRLLDGDLPLRIIGDGPLAHVIEQHAAHDPRLSYLGRQPRDVVLSEMRSALALLVPSVLYETFGLIIAEAFACGTPVITSALGAMAELVEDGKTGLHFRSGDASDLIAKVRWAADHPEEMRHMGNNGRKVYEEKYTSGRNYSMLIDVYDQAIEHGADRAR